MNKNSWWICALIASIIILAFHVQDNRDRIESIENVFSPPESGLATSPAVGPAHTFDDLLDALRWEESKDGRYIYGDYKELSADWEPKESYPLKEYGRDIVPIYCEWDDELKKATYFEAQAVGDYQIHKIYVDDVNRIILMRIDSLYSALGTHVPIVMVVDGEVEIVTSFDYNDRQNRDKSRAMTTFYLTHYGNKFRDTAHPDIWTAYRFEVMARIHNGGPKGYLKESTHAYWLKVKSRMESAQ